MLEYFDAVLLARIQFAFTVAFHIVFPAFSIGLASFLAVLEGLWLITGKDKYIDLFHYWKKIFAIAFGMGVVSGLVMSYQFGTNWSVFSDKTGPVLGPLLGYEVLSAFFLEAGFLGIMLFGMDKVGKGLHFTATALVAIGTLFSAFWILSVNSWMQTPAGYGINEVGQFIPVNWFEVIFNPSFPYRLVHMVLAAYLSTSFIVGAVAAFHLLKDSANQHARTMFSLAIWMATIVAPLQLLAGDMHGLNTLEYQPQKVAAMEGNWETGTNVPLLLFAIPDEDARENRMEIAIPNGASLILTHKADGEVPGLNDFVTEDGEVLHPPVAPVFFAFRIMVGTGMAMLLLSWAGVYFMARRRDAGAVPKPLLVVLVPMAFSGWVATLAGWYTTEIGRQPWLVQGVLSTKDAVADVPAPFVGMTLVTYLAIYAALLAAYIFVLFFLATKASRGETVHPSAPQSGEAVARQIPAE